MPINIKEKTIINICREETLKEPILIVPVKKPILYGWSLVPLKSITIFESIIDIPIALIKALIRELPPAFVDLTLLTTSQYTRRTNANDTNTIVVISKYHARYANIINAIIYKTEYKIIFWLIFSLLKDLILLPAYLI